MLMGDDSLDLHDTELHDAVRYGDIDEVQVALENGLDPNQIGIYEWAPLHEAASNGDREILEKLLDYGGNPNKKDLLKGFTAVHYAAKNGHEECLRRLLEKGGRYDVLSNNGESCFDVATEQCLKILQMQKVKDIIDTDSDATLSENKEERSKENDATQPDRETRVDTTVDDDVDGEILPKEPAKSSTKTAWIRDLGENPDKEPIAGFVHLSFEYNSKKSKLKIRVWQVSEILLPPVETSMFNAIYVKSYLQPDGKHKTKRRTEDIKLDNPELPITKAHYKSLSHDKEVSLHAVFQPMSFKFSKSLDYENITKEMVEERTVEIVVCVIQKYTRRSFMIAKLLIPLKDAVKKLLREKIALKPCLQTNMQEKVRPYPMGVLKVISNNRLFGGSNPNIRVSPLFVPDEGRAVSDSDLKHVTVGSQSEAVVLSLPTEDPSETESLQSVSVEEFQSGSTCSVSFGEEPVDSGFETSPRDSVPSVSPPAQVRRKLPKNDDMKSQERTPVYDEQLDVESGQRSRGVVDTLSSAEDGHMTKFDTVEELNSRSYRVALNSWVSPSSSRPDSPASYLTSSSRPDTPSWDDYMQPLEMTGVIPVDAKEEEYHPPMAMSMNLPQTLQTFRPVDLDKSGLNNLPGQAEFHLENDIQVAGKQTTSGKTKKQTRSGKTEKQSLPGHVQDDVATVKTSVSKRSVPVMGARAAISPPPGDRKYTKSPSFELQHVAVRSGAHPGKVLRVQTENVKNERGESETTFVEGAVEDYAKSPANRTQTQLGSFDTRPVNSPDKWNEASAAKLKHLASQQPKSHRLTAVPVSDGGSVSPVNQRPFSPTNQRPIITTNERPSSPGNQRPMGPTNQRSMSPANQRPMSPANPRPMSPANQRPMTPTNQRPMSPNVDAAKERLKQKLLIKKQRIMKQREHELLVLDASHPKPGSVQAVHVNPNDLESDV